MKNSDLSIYFIFLISASVVLLNRFTPFHITDYRVHFFFNFFAASSMVIIVARLFKKLQTARAILLVCAAVGILLFLKAFLTWGGDWKTQVVIYRNIEDQNTTINYQMRGDRFAFGYKKRIVQITSLVPFMEWTTDIDTNFIDKSKWEKINLRLNEMQFPKEL